MNFLTQYSYQQKNGAKTALSLKYATFNDGEDMTQQSDKDDSDINIMMVKYGASGRLPQVLQQPLYGDFTNVSTYKEAAEMVRAAKEAFMEVPAEIRERFNNDPQQFIDFSTDPKNIDELVKMKLADKRELPQNKDAGDPPEPKGDKTPK